MIAEAKRFKKSRMSFGFSTLAISFFPLLTIHSKFLSQANPKPLKRIQIRAASVWSSRLASEKAKVRTRGRREGKTPTIADGCEANFSSRHLKIDQRSCRQSQVVT